MILAYHDNPNFSLFANGSVVGPHIKIFPESWDEHNLVSPALFHMEMMQPLLPPFIQKYIHT